MQQGRPHRGPRSVPEDRGHVRNLAAGLLLFVSLGAMAIPALGAAAPKGAPHARVALVTRGAVAVGNHRRLRFSVRGLDGARAPVQVRLSMPAMVMHTHTLYARTMKNGSFRVITPVGMAGNWVAHVRVGGRATLVSANIPFRALSPALPLPRRLVAALAAAIVVGLGLIALRLARRPTPAKGAPRAP